MDMIRGYAQNQAFGLHRGKSARSDPATGFASFAPALSPGATGTIEMSQLQKRGFRQRRRPLLRVSPEPVFE